MKNYLPAAILLLSFHMCIAQNVGIGTNTPTGPLSFPSALGNKIVLWGNGTGSHYGIGVQSSQFQFYADAPSANIVFGSGSSSNFKERVSIINSGANGMFVSGRLSIANGTNPLDLNAGGGIWLYKADNSGLLGFMGTQNNQNIGFYGGSAGWGLVMNTANGNIGLGNMPDPTAPLQFSNTSLARKLVFWQNNNVPAAFAGIGNNNGGLVYQTADVSYDHIFSANSGQGSYEVMRIRGLGKVGIMVSNPQSTLEVGGRIRLYSNLLSDGGSSGIWFRNAANSVDAAFLGMINDQAIGVTSNNIVRLLVNTVNGNVGIGTENPVAPLTLSNQSGDKIVLQDLSISGQFAIRTGSQLLQFAVPGVQDEISFGYGSAGNFTDKLRIAYNGNVGIGTNHPIANLEVVSKSLWSQLTLASTNAPGFGKIDFVSDYGQANQWRPAYIISDDGGDFTGILNFYTNGTGAANKNNSKRSLMLQNGLAFTATGSVGVFSDERLKQNITPFTDGLEVINQINPVQFQYKSGAPFASSDEQVGVIAQELEKVAPYMVNKTSENGVNDLRWVNNQAYTFLLINAVKQQQAEIEELRAQVKLLLAQKK